MISSPFEMLFERVCRVGFVLFYFPVKGKVADIENRGWEIELC